MTYAWVVTFRETCEQVGVSCDALGEDGCRAYADCRWLTPTCMYEPILGLGDAGCFAAQPCDDGSCPAGRVCREVALDPCTEAGCDGSCADRTMLCVAGFGSP